MRMHLRKALILGGLIVLVAGGAFAVRRLVFVRRASQSIRVTTIYTECGHTKDGGPFSSPALTYLAGQAGRTRFGDWRVLRRNEREIHLAYEIDGLCPACQRARFLGVADGFVAVYAGTPVHRGRPVEITRIPAAALPQAELADLLAGIVFRDDKERLQLLEGLAALVSD